MKVINILTHLPQGIIHKYKDPEEYVKEFPKTEFIKLSKEPYWVGFFKQDWHHHWGGYIKAVSPNIKMECWRPYGSVINSVFSLEVDGVEHKVFPSKTAKIPKVGEFMSSPLMLEELKKERNNAECIIHFYGAHDSLINYLLINLKPVSCKIIIQQLGAWFGYYDIKSAKPYVKPFKYLLWQRELKALKYCDLFLTASKVEEEFIKRTLNLKYKFFLNGINFDIYKSKQTKSETRQLYKINDDAKVILYIGRLNATKNANLLIDAFVKVKKRIPQTQLLLVGCYKNDEYYQMAINAGATVILRNDSELDVFFNMSDLYVLPIKDKNIQDFGGFGIAPIEALAYNMRVISPNIKHFAGTNSEREIIGSEIKDFEKLDELLVEEIQRKDIVSGQIRDIAKKYFDIIENSKEMVLIYQDLMKVNKYNA